MTCTKIQAALEQIQIFSLYTSFECQVKCTSNLESALSVTVQRITVQILIATATVQLLK